MSCLFQFCNKQHDEEEANIDEEEPFSEIYLERSNSSGSFYNFFTIGDMDIVEFKSPTNDIFGDIQRRTSEMHDEFLKSGKSYDNIKEKSCSGWTVRALGIIDNLSLYDTICERKQTKKGIQLKDFIEKINPYVGNLLNTHVFGKVNIETLMLNLERGYATIINLNNISSYDGHTILAIRRNDGTRLLYDPSQYENEKRIWGYGAFSRILQDRGFQNDVECFIKDPNANSESTSTQEGKKLPPGITIGGKTYKRKTYKRKTYKRKTYKRKIYKRKTYKRKTYKRKSYKK
jgi:hypothetical protein